MNMFKRSHPEIDRGNPVDLDNLAEALRSVPPLQRRPDEFAPRQPSALRQMEDAIEHIESFLALPLKEIDDTMAVLKAEYDAAVAEGQTIRDTIMAVRDDYLAQIKRRQALTGIARETFAMLKERCAALDAPAVEEPPQGQTATEREQGEA